MERVKLSKSAVEDKIRKAGMTRGELAQYFGLPLAQMNKAVKQLGLQNVKASKVLFEIVEDEQETVVETGIQGAPVEAVGNAPEPAPFANYANFMNH